MVALGLLPLSLALSAPSVRAAASSGLRTYPRLLQLSTLVHSGSTANHAVRLRSLCNLAKVAHTLAETRQQLDNLEQTPTQPDPHLLERLSADLQKGAEDVAQSLSDLGDATIYVNVSQVQPLHKLREEASTLHAKVEKQHQQLQDLQRDALVVSCTERAREMFTLLDTNQDGVLQLEEFVQAASLLTPVPKEKLSGTLEARFKLADVGGDGNLDFDEFAALLSSLSRDSIGPLRLTRARDLRQLLAVTLEMTSLTLARELTLVYAEPRRDGANIALRLAQLESCVDRWCSIREKAEESFSRRMVEDDSEAVDAACVVDEKLLVQVGDLAGELSLTNVTSSFGWSVRRNGVSGLRSMVSSISFCLRGLRIMAGDVSESISLLINLFRGEKLTARDSRLLRRTVIDAIALVPYTIIMIVPLSPPGHVFAFSLLNRCFPGAVPSAFTTQRQDVDEIYSRIAAEANAETPRKNIARDAGGIARSAAVAACRGVKIGFSATASLFRAGLTALGKGGSPASEI